jgi:AraC family transcriptional regulator
MKNERRFGQMDSLAIFEQRGYVVKETGPVYYTVNMDKTVQWFEEVLGWHYEIDERGADGIGLYGCVYDLPREFENLHIAPFTGIHMFYGEPKGGTVAFIKVQGIEALHSYVKTKGWADITDIKLQPWGAKMTTVTTPDDYVLQFFE